MTTMLKHAGTRHHTRDDTVSVEWHERWSSTVDEAFSAMPYDHLMDAQFVRRLWFDTRGHAEQRIGIVRNAARSVVGILPLKRREFKGVLSWQFLTQYVQPYARFFVLPEYTDATLAALHRYIACNNVLFYQQPTHRGVVLHPEESWIVHLPDTYDELMRRNRDTHREERRIRRRTGGLTVLEDRVDDLPVALAHWRRTWLERGSPETATRSGDLLAGYRILAEQRRLKTFSLYDGSTFVGMSVNMIGAEQLYFLLTTTKDEYKPLSPGMYLILLSLEWACANGFQEYDMLRTSGQYKRHWAEPEVRGYRFILSPFDRPLLGTLGEEARRYYNGIARRARRLPSKMMATLQHRENRSRSSI